VAADLEFRVGAVITDLKKDLAAALREVKNYSAQAREALLRDSPRKPSGAAREAAREAAKEAAALARAAAKESAALARAAEKEAAALARAAEKARKNAQGLGSSISAATSSLGRLVAGFVSLAAAAQLIRTGDTFASLNARIRLTTSSVEEFNRAQVALFDIAQRAGSPLESTVKLYSQIALAVRDAKVGQETLLGVVETISQAAQLSGDAIETTDAAVIQLGQGLASNTLRGDELVSVLEGAPPLADAIAKGMGLTRAELRLYGEQGKISAEQIIRALQRQRAEVAAQFALLPPTVGRSVTMLKNAGLALVGAFDKTSGLTAGFARVIKSIADYLSSDAVAGAVVQFATTWSNAFSDLAKDIQNAARLISEAIGEITNGKLAGGDVDLFGFLARALRDLPINLRAVVKIATIELAAFADSAITLFKGVGSAIKAVFDPTTTVAQIQAGLVRAREVIDAARTQATDAAFAERDKALAEAQKARDAVLAARERGRKKTNATGLGNFKKIASATDQQAADTLRKAELDAEERLEKDSSDRKLSVLQTYFDDSRIAAAAYYRQRESIELAALDQSIAIERRRAQGGTAADKAKALADIEILERQKADIARKGARDRFQAQRDLDRELESARAQDLDGRGQTGDAAKIRLEAQFRDLLKRLEAEGNTAGERLIRGLIDTGVAKARFDELQAEFSRVANALQARTQAIGDQQRTGALPTGTAEAQTRVARKDAIDQLTVLNGKLQELAAASSNPQIAEGAASSAAALRQMAIDSATGIDAAIINLRAGLANMEQGFAQATTGAGVDALTGLFTDLASGSKSAKDAIRDFARGFVASMVQIAARALATFAVLSLLEAVFPGAGKTAASAGSVASVASRTLHSGGMAGQGAPRRVNPLVFAGAPRYHSGALVGLKPDERPAILQTGEEVLSRTDQRNANNGGNGKGGGYRIVNVLDPALVSNYLESAAGEKTILNVIQRNPSQVRQVIGG